MLQLTRRQLQMTIFVLTSTATVLLCGLIGHYRQIEPQLRPPPVQSVFFPGVTGLLEASGLPALLSERLQQTVTPEMIRAVDAELLETLRQNAETVTPETFHAVTGYTVNAFADKFGGGGSRDFGNNGKAYFELGFTGDINFTETGYVMPHARELENGVLDCIDETFRDEMKAVDLMLINNEFPYSSRGAPLPGKRYTFRAKPESVQALLDLGVGLVSLANNHTCDYGEVSFFDTLETLQKADLPYVGAGMNLAEASAPVTFLINGYKVGFLACSSVESPIQTPVATETSFGVFGAYDSGEAMAEAIRQASVVCDYVIAYPHWGIENTTTFTPAQITNSKKYIDAGACAVIGNHPHVLQGMELYRGCPIVYSLGNFWFNARTQPNGLLKIRVSETGLETIFVPGRQVGSEVHYMEDAGARRALFDDIETWPPSVISITDDGILKSE